MRNYKNRSEYMISTTKDSQKLDNDWFSSLENQLEKQAVKSRKDDDSLFNQITSIISNKSGKYRSVEDKVKEMQERSGYLSYSSSEYLNTKVADKDEVKKNSKPQILIQYPEIEVTINNYISDTHGTQNVPAILSYIRNIHKRDINDDTLWDAEDFIKFIDKLNQSTVGKSQDDTSRNLGKIDRTDQKDIDPSNYDAFHSLMPVTR